MLPQYIIFSCEDIHNNIFEVRVSMIDIINFSLGKNGRVESVAGIKLGE